ncbi:TPA: filamentous hemagglutinin N-terminal domain-containing protein [Campylobacter coli]|nr:filamentous hemagglutinin N-terminal domain-containing protein [Campylobacter coli]
MLKNPNRVLCVRRGANKTNILNIKHFFNTSSYFASRFTKSSRTIVNISLIASLALSQSLAAVTLPSGGKFVNGTGSITKPNDKTMNIAGNKPHNVIAWGGGFNIGKDASVNFTTSGKSYLNLDYTNKASQILGKLNGGTNNIYLVNPSGVLIGEGATINANNFGVSTTPIDINEINDFSNYGSFSPVLSTNTKGDVVNMGTINANEIVLVGNKVENIKGTLQGKDQDFANQVTIEGNKVYLEGVGIKATNLEATINEDGYFTYDTGILYEFYDKNNKKLDYSFKGSAVTNNDFKEYLYIGGKYADNDQMNDSWDGFINLFNEGKLQEWGFNDIYLGNDIDFAGKDVINPIGDDTNPFTANFYGNGYTLSNLQIGPSGDYVGLFGYIDGGSVQDLTIDRMQFLDRVSSYKYIGGLAGYIEGGTFSNITLENITGGIYSPEVVGAGGFAGKIEGGDFDNIILDTIKDFNDNLDSITSGGFAGEINTGTFDNISLSNLGNIRARDYAGGFAGKINGGSYINIDISKIGDVNEGAKASIVSSSKTDYEKGSYAGGFAGYIKSGTYSNIVLNDIAGINATLEDGKNFISDLVAYAGGFAGYIESGTFRAIDFKNISTGIQTELNGYKNVKHNYAGGFAGKIDDGDFSNIVLNNIGDISSNGDWSSAGGFVGKIDYSSGNFSNIVLNNIGNIGSISGGISPYEYGFTGGFAGWIDYSSGNFSNITLNNIGDIRGSGFTGGFVGKIVGGNITLSNIVLNNIVNISGSNNRNKFSSAGGFTGGIYSGNITLSNIVLNNIGGISSRNSGSSDGFAGGFAGWIHPESVDFSNIVLNNIGNISGSGINSSSAGGFIGEIVDGSVTFSNIYFYGTMSLSGNKTNQNHIDSHNQTALKLTNASDLQTIQNHMQNDSTLKNLEYVAGTNGNPYLHMVTNGNIGGEGSEITFDEENFTYTPNIPEINPDGSGTSSLPEVSNEGELSDVVVGRGDFEEEILKIIINDILNNEYVLNIDTIDFEKFNEDDLAIILYLLKNTADEESIRQSLDFYTEFNKGETDGLKLEFEKWYGDDSSSTYSISMEKYESIERLKGYVNGTLKPELESIRNNLNRFESLKAEIERLAKVYQEALDNNLIPYEQLEIIYKNTQEKIDAYYAEAESLLETLHGDNKSFLVKLFEKKYNFKDRYNDDSLTGSFSFVGSNVDGNLDYKGSLIGKEVEDSALGDKPILSLPGNENSGDDQTINRGEGAEIAKTLAKQADLASGESVIVLPAEETQNVIDEGERELGRVCIVSDNAKTSNPCIAIAF